MPQCEMMKTNSKQCPNPAIVLVGTTPMCRLDFNWFLNSQILSKTKVDATHIAVIDAIDQPELDRLIDFTNTTIDHE